MDIVIKTNLENGILSGKIITPGTDNTVIKYACYLRKGEKQVIVEKQPYSSEPEFAFELETDGEYVVQAYIQVLDNETEKWEKYTKQSDPIIFTQPVSLKNKDNKNNKAKLFKRNAYRPARFHKVNEMRVACILEPSIQESLTVVCSCFSLNPDNWQGILKNELPDLLLVSSFMDDQRWSEKELTKVVLRFNKESIPVVYWDTLADNKIASLAALSDAVFTVDFDKIQKYREELGHDNIWHLNFAAQLPFYNPVETYVRQNNCCYIHDRYTADDSFASLFENHPVLGALEKKLDIFEREWASDAASVLPKQYRNSVVGRLSSSEAGIAYKNYIYGLIVNSAAQSQSAFSGEVFNLMASNTIVLSNYSRGQKNYFGDITICTDQKQTIEQNTAQFCGNQESLHKYRLLGLRRVLEEHTYEDRLISIIEKLYGNTLHADLPHITVLAFAGSSEDAKRIEKMFSSQTYENKELVFIGSDLPDKKGDYLYLTPEEGEKPLSFLRSAGYVTTFDPHDWYGENYLKDLALSTRYRMWRGVGKTARYVENGGAAVLTFPNAVYRKTLSLCIRRAILRCDCVDSCAINMLRGEFELTGTELLGVDEFNYCENWAEDFCEKAGDLFIPDQGLPVSEINAANDKILSLSTVQLEKQWKHKEIVDLISTSDERISYSLSKSGLVFVSKVPKGKNSYIWLSEHYDTEQWKELDESIELSFDALGSLDFRITLECYDENGDKLSAYFVPLNRRIPVQFSDMARSFKLGFRISGPGKVTLKSIYLKTASPRALITRSNVLMVTNKYPSPEDLYSKMFIHARVSAFRSRGHVVDVFQVIQNDIPAYREYQGVNVAVGTELDLSAFLSGSRLDIVCAHYMSKPIWEALKPFVKEQKIRLFIWMHGADSQPWWRREYNFTTDEELTRAKALSDTRMKMWNSIFEAAKAHSNIHFVFVSEYFARETFEDYKLTLNPQQYSVIPNLIDTSIFRYKKKDVEQRKRVLSIKSYASRVYANDLTAEGILKLSERPCFKDMEFDLYGQGKLFWEVNKPLKAFPNVHLHETFLSQQEIYSLHETHGIFIATTRSDTQGVSRGEAMSSGLVAIANECTAVPEFMDDSCGILIPPENYEELADALEQIYYNPAQFSELSANAAKRIRKQTSAAYTIDKELKLIEATTRTAGNLDLNRAVASLSEDEDIDIDSFGYDLKIQDGELLFSFTDIPKHSKPLKYAFYVKRDTMVAYKQKKYSFDPTLRYPLNTTGNYAVTYYIRQGEMTDSRTSESIPYYPLAVNVQGPDMLMSLVEEFQMSQVNESDAEMILLDPLMAVEKYADQFMTVSDRIDEIRCEIEAFLNRLPSVTIYCIHWTVLVDTPRYKALQRILREFYDCCRDSGCNAVGLPSIFVESVEDEDNSIINALYSTRKHEIKSMVQRAANHYWDSKYNLSVETVIEDNVLHAKAKYGAACAGDKFTFYLLRDGQVIEKNLNWSENNTKSWSLTEPGEYQAKAFFLSGDFKTSAVSDTSVWPTESTKKYLPTVNSNELEWNQQYWIEQYIGKILRIPDSNGTRYYRKSPHRIGLICDEFYYDSVSDVADFIYISPENWHDVLNEGIDAMLFISTWNGIHNNEWKGLGSKGLVRSLGLSILRECKKRNIPTIFYSKEDPPNYEQFLDYAQNSDYVFTSAAECIPLYEKDCGKRPLGAIPFAVNPILNNPIGSWNHKREKLVLFAGTWMRRYPERCKEISIIFQGVLDSAYGLKIIDRHYTDNYEAYQYPKEYDPYIVSSVSHQTLQKLQKMFDWSINVNSVKNSTTMFALRTFELLANGVLLFSNYSPGLNRILPMAQIVTQEQETSRILDVYTEEELYQRQITAVRTVLTGHTYFERLEQMLAPLGLLDRQPIRRILVLCDVRTPGIEDSFRRQTFAQKDLAVASEVDEGLLSQYDMVAWFADNSYYGPFYLEDMSNGFKYTSCDYITKDAWFESGTLHNGAEHTYVSEMKSKYRTLFWREAYEPDTLLKMDGSRSMENGYSIDHFNYEADPIVSSSAQCEYKLSVVLPVYNNGLRLYGKAFSSLLRSSMFSDMEIILVDIGSDETETLAYEEQLTRDYGNVRLMHTENSGATMFDAFLEAKNSATGDYVVFLDPETDEAVNDVYAAMYQTAQTDGADLVICNRYRLNTDDIKEDGFGSLFKEAIKQKEASDNNMISPLQPISVSIPLQCMLIKRDLLAEIDINSVKRDSLLSQMLIDISKKSDATEQFGLMYYEGI